MFLFKFQAVAGDKKNVLEQGLWPINGYHLVVKPGQWIQIKYEQIPISCYQCGKLGHAQPNCTATNSSWSVLAQVSCLTISCLLSPIQKAQVKSLTDCS